MLPIACALLTAIAFYFSIGLGEQWWLAWLAPVPVVWLAFGKTKPWPVFFAAWAGCALGASSILRAYAGILPAPVLIVAIGAPSFFFAVSVMGARAVFRTQGALFAMVAFAAIWTASDFLASFDKAGGSVATPAAAEVGAPMLIQSASLVGYMGITFLLGLVSAGLALTLATRKPAPAAIAVVLFAANAGYACWRMSAPSKGAISVALVESDDTVGAISRVDRAKTFKAVDAYAGEIAEIGRKTGKAQARLIVLPENIARLDPAWRGEAEAKLAAAATAAHATVVAGFNTSVDGAQRNVSLAFTPGAAQPMTYMKRRLVPVLETSIYAPGPGPMAMPNGIGLEICKDMDFQAMIRADAVATHPLLLAVPAWDFDQDDWSHGRVAILRSVENGVPMARTARDGLLTLNDRYGRLRARVRTTGGFTTVIGTVPLDGRGGDTLYDRIGDAFGWLCLALGLGLVGLSFVRHRETT